MNPDRADLIKLATAVMETAKDFELESTARGMLKARSPDPMFCRNPARCIAGGRCQSDPVCND